MFSLSSAQVERYVESEEFKQFSVEVSERLNVNDLFSCIEYREVEKKFPYKTALAFIHFENNQTEFGGVYFVNNRIASEAEKLYPNCMDGIKKKEILKILVDFLLIHELTHLAQFKRGCNEELKDHTKLKGQKYKSSWVEREANIQAYKCLKKRNEFTRNVSFRIWRVFNE